MQQRSILVASRAAHCSTATTRSHISQYHQQICVKLPIRSLCTLHRSPCASNSNSSRFSRTLQPLLVSSAAASLMKTDLVDGNRCTKRYASITTTDTSADDFEHELSSLMECLQILLESARFERANLDVNLADGVLSVASPTAGTWVLNKHTPTRQIWLSSPMSGPCKFNFHSEEAAKYPSSQVGEGWRGERDLTDSLKHRIISEWKQAFAVEIDPVADFRSEHQ